jgi:predicted ArsR family transcriptional regulator
VTSTRAQRAATGADLLASPARRSIVEALRRHRPVAGEVDVGGMTAAELGRRLGLHPTTVRFHTDRLEAAGLVVSHLSTAFGVGRPRKVYAAAPVVAEVDRVARLVRLTRLLTESFGADLTPAQAGAQWARAHVDRQGAGPAASPGEWLARLGRLVDVLGQWGYTVDLTTTGQGRSCRIDLTACPFRDLARTRPEVVCGIHEGLLSGVLGQLGETQVEVTLRPFVGPDLCHAHVSTLHPFESTHEELPDES